MHAQAAGHRPVVLVPGHSAGYGLAALLAGLRRHGIRGVGVGFEAADGRVVGLSKVKVPRRDLRSSRSTPA